MFGHLDLACCGDEKFDIYKCSLCHTLGKEYGIMARLFTNYDMVLCILTALNTGGLEVKTKKKLCPMISMNTIIENESPLLKYLAAVTVLLVSEKIKDDIHDEQIHVPHKMVQWLAKKRTNAEIILKNYGFDPFIIENAFTVQRMYEKREDVTLDQMTEPSALVMSKIYASAAIINGIPEYENAFRQIGYSIGQIIYLLDSVVDYRSDISKNLFNPLRKCYSNHKETNSTIPPAVYEKIFLLLKDSQRDIESVIEKLPDISYLRDIFTERLAKKIAEAMKSTDVPEYRGRLSFIKRIREASPLSLFLTFSSKLAFASNSKELGNSCVGSIIFLIIMFIAYRIICGGCCKGCGGPPQDKVTVDHGCGKYRTYKKDSCSNRYK